MEPFEFGSAHKLNSQAFLNPKNIKLNKHGNLTRNKMSQLKAKPDVFVGDVGGVNSVWQRRKVKKTKKGKKTAEAITKWFSSFSTEDASAKAVDSFW